MVRYSQRLTGSCSSVDGSMLKMLTRQGHHYFLKPKIKKQRNWDFSFISLNKESLQKNFANLQLICSERNKTYILPRTRTKIIDLFLILLPRHWAVQQKETLQWGRTGEGNLKFYKKPNYQSLSCQAAVLKFRAKNCQFKTSRQNFAAAHLKPFLNRHLQNYFLRKVFGLFFAKIRFFLFCGEIHKLLGRVGFI